MPADGGHDPGGAPSQGEWLGLAEAAERLGCSVDTLRRRIKRREVDARQVTTKHGPAWQLRLGPRGVQTVGTTVGATGGTAAQGPQAAEGQHAQGRHADGVQEGGHEAEPAAEGGHEAEPAAEGGQAPGQDPLGLELVRLVDRLQRENLFLAGQVGFLQAKLQTAEETIRLLEAPRAPATAPPEASTGGGEAAAVPAAPAAPEGGAQDPVSPAATGGRTDAATDTAGAPSGWWRRALGWLRG
jgi:hypothetical protein